ncbi:MAG: response regulator [Bacteroidia bacterium]
MDYSFRKIAVIDDSDLDRYILARFVSKYAFAKEVIDFNLAQKALGFFTEHQQNISVLPELIFLDINMPCVNGFQFLDCFELFPEAVKKQTRIVMLTSSNNPFDLEKAFKYASVCEYYNKPINEDKLKQLIQKLKNIPASVS